MARHHINKIIAKRSEFDWSAGQGTLVQVAFPGIFPDLTRYQAEADQVSVNNGHSPWKRDAAMVAQTTAITLLKWSDKAQTTVLSGGGSRDVDAVVQVQSTSPDHPVIRVSLFRDFEKALLEDQIALDFSRN